MEERFLNFFSAVRVTESRHEGSASYREFTFFAHQGVVFFKKNSNHDGVKDKERQACQISWKQERAMLRSLLKYTHFFDCNPGQGAAGMRNIVQNIQQARAMLRSLLYCTHFFHCNSGQRTSRAGLHETNKIDQFSYGVASRASSILMPRETNDNGYFGDRRPFSNTEPNNVTATFVRTCLEEKERKMPMVYVPTTAPDMARFKFRQQRQAC